MSPNFSKLSSKWEGLKNYLYKHYGQETGKLIVHTGLATWTMAALAQIGAIVFNDKIPKDQKKFLIPQEILDGAINILAFYTITNSLKNIAGKLCSTGKWSNKAIRNFVAKNPPKNMTEGGKMGELTTNLTKIYKGNEDFYQAYSPFKNGVDMIATTIGSVVSSNVIAPYIRNPIAAVQQKRSIEREKANTYPNNGMRV